MSNCPTPHIAATKDQIAKTVIMPGDPKRSEFFAKTFLENPQLVNNIRGVQGYTGTYGGKPVTIMSSGMGISSMGIYAYELFNFYDVDRIIRVGTAGSIREDLNEGELLIAETALIDNNFIDYLPVGENYVPQGTPALVQAAASIAAERGFKHRIGTVLTEIFYYNYADDMIEKWSVNGVDAFEMETACLYAFAKAAGKEALSILSISNNIVFKTEMDPALRETGLTNMLETALAMIK